MEDGLAGEVGIVPVDVLVNNVSPGMIATARVVAASAARSIGTLTPSWLGSIRRPQMYLDQPTDITTQ